jgi:hypothetical protein
MTAIGELTGLHTSYAARLTAANTSLRTAAVAPIVDTHRVLTMTSANFAQSVLGLETQLAARSAHRILTKPLEDLVAQTTRPLYEGVAKSVTAMLAQSIPSAADTLLAGLKPVFDAQQSLLDSAVKAMQPTRDWLVSALPSFDFYAGFRTSRAFVGRLAYMVRRVKDALTEGDLEPARSFIAKYLKARPTPDRVQSLALALIEGSWTAAVDMDDDAAVISELRRLTNLGNEMESDHTIGRRRILVLPELWTPSLVSGQDPEAEAFARVLAREDQFADTRVTRALARLKTDADRDVAYAYADNHGISWADAASSPTSTRNAERPPAPLSSAPGA